MDFLTAAAGGLLGSLFTALAFILFGPLRAARYSVSASDKKRAIDSTLDIFRQYQSPGFFQNRLVAERSPCREPLPMTIDELNTRARGDWESFRLIFSFFEELAALRDCGYIDEELTRSLLGKHYIHWFGRCLYLCYNVTGGEWLEMSERINSLETLFSNGRYEYELGNTKERLRQSGFVFERSK